MSNTQVVGPVPTLPSSQTKKIPLVEMFGPTIQGEGAVIGQQTYFLRFGLCDYKCVMCDSMNAVDPRAVKQNAQWLDQSEIMAAFDAFHKPNTTVNVTFSGGNPCIHDLSLLVQVMKEEGYNIFVETQGTFCPEWLWGCDQITVSPKGPGMGERLELDKLDSFLTQMYGHPKVNLKVVVFDQRDIEVAAMLFERYCSDRVIPRLASPGQASRFYLSLGNPFLNHTELEGTHSGHITELLRQYKSLLTDIQTHPVLCNVPFLPQFHVLLWGNQKGV